ncbi:hypothetical protein GOP47_0011903 [Adiantum capillus-veneris]|uniref:J domain-containing protein n=1 Tax=Adiantum capillus-veneris TaxID=13818 RepID=A0A9D4UTM2_ADICA|nr:hypothetical protein GOP47_0011903 [Adiantum capillus-veneris]
MECNKDEALRSKVLAEAKFSQRDYVGARKFAHKAKQLYPELEGLAQFIYVLDVHIVAQNKLQSGENNWYGILEVEPFAEENTIRKQYRRLALLLHPDKNKALGAEAAFKHISEAWTVLSDKNKKAAYDARCQGKMAPPGGRAPQQNSAPNTVSKSTPTTIPAFVPPFQRRVHVEQPQPAPSRPPQPATAPLPPKPHPVPPFAPPVPNSVSFWTSCPSCRMLLEYQRIYLLKNLCCPVCYKPFVATEVGSVSGTLLWPLPPKQQGYRVGAFSNGFVPTSAASDGFPVPQFGSFPFGNAKVRRKAQSAATPSANIPQQEEEKVERCAMPRKLTPEIQQRVEERIMDVQARLKRHFMAAEGQNSAEVKQKVPKKSTKEELKAKAAADAREVSNRLMAKLKGVIEQKLSAEKEKKLKAESADTSKAKASVPQTDASSNNGDLKSSGGLQGNQVSADKFESATCENPLSESRKSPKGKRAATTLGNDKHDGLPPSKKVKNDAESAVNGNENTAQVKESSGPAQDLDTVVSKASTQGSGRTRPSLIESTESMEEPAARDSNVIPMVNESMTVPDAEFYDFDKDRTEGHFLPGQVWAAYDDDDGMPRYYARVNKIVSSQPFKIQIAWLEARSGSDETLAWLDSGFSLTCGEFRVGKSISSDSINMYSHKMNVEKGQRGGFRIYPRRGDIWALYKNWENMIAKDGKPGYLVAEILVDFKEEEGVQVCQLAKLNGYKTLFQRQAGEEHSVWIRTSDMRRFSHRIPAYYLTSDQVPGKEEGCWELDPASTPLELIS